MYTIFFGTLLAISILVLVFMSQKNYENIDIYYWTVAVLIPVVILGYWLKTQVTTTEGAVLAFSFIYIDCTVLLTVMLFSIIRFMRITPPSWVKVLAYLLAIVHLAMIWLCIDNNLYYKSIRLVDTGQGIATKMTDGPLKIFHWIYLAIMLFIICITIVVAFIKKGTYSRRILYIYATLTLVGLIMYLVETIVDVNFSMLPLVYVIADVIIAIDYDRSHTHDLSGLISNQQKYYGNKGYIAFDMDGCYLSCNDKMIEILPELSHQIVDEKLEEGSRLEELFYPLIEMLRNGQVARKFYQDGDIIYKCEGVLFSVRKDGRNQGYLFDIQDATEEQRMLQLTQDYNKTLNEEVEKKTQNIKNIQEEVVLGLANMVENRDNNTGGHVKRTSDIIKYIVQEIINQDVFDIDEQFAEDIVRAAPMHDLGKITIDSSILQKPGRFTEEEFAIMKTHSAKSGEIVNIILRNVEEKHFVDVAFNVARYHHERWDGNGYPDGLMGEMIPLEARIMAVADVYDALVSKRCYKEAMSFEKAREIMVAGMGTQFDPNMLTVFLGCREKLEEYYS